MNVFEAFKLECSKFLKLNMNPKAKLMVQAQQIFEQEMDFVTILKKLQDVEKLKAILLNENQLRIFNLLAKPMIYCQSEHSLPLEDLAGSKLFHMLSSNSNISKNDNINETKCILKAYKEMKESAKVNEIDQRLMNLIDKNLEDFCLHYKSNETL